MPVLALFLITIIVAIAGWAIWLAVNDCKKGNRTLWLNHDLPAELDRLEARWNDGTPALIKAHIENSRKMLKAAEQRLKDDLYR